MTIQRTTLVWPFMLALTFLFALSLTAPRSWETVAHRTSLRIVKVGIRLPPEATMSDAIASGVTPAVPAARTATNFAPSLNSPSQPSEPTPVSAAIQTVVPQLNATSAVTTNPIEHKVDANPQYLVTPNPATVSTPVEAVASTVPVVGEVAPTIQSPRLSGAPCNSGSPAPQSATSVIAQSPVQSGPQPTIAQPSLSGPQPIPSVQQPVLAVPQPSVAGQQPAQGPVQVASRPVEPVLSTPIVAPVAAAPVVQSWWPEPVDLVTRLDKLRTHRETSSWADRASALLKRLATAGDPTSPVVVDVLDDLRTVAAEPVALDENRLEPALAVELRLARHALLRRVDVWESLTHVLREGGAVVDAVLIDDQQDQDVELCLAELEQQTSSAGETGLQWRNYLLVDSLRQTLQNGNQNERKHVARQVLARIRQAGANRDQNAFLHQGPFARLDNLLRGWAEEDVDPRRLLAGIERFEQGGLPSDGRELAEESRLLQGSSNESKQRLAVWLTSHYRNSNVRVTFSDDLLNRILPDSLKKQAAVNDTILGLPTRGWSTARTGLAVRFLPSCDKLAMRLEAQGVVSSQTRTFSGPVRLFSHNNAQFAAHKDLLISPEGVRANPSVAAANGSTKLRSVESDYDGVPILGGIVQSMAIDRHDEKRPAALREAAWKVARNVERNLDTDIEQQLSLSGTKLKERVITPLERMQLTPQVIDLQTLEDRATVRLRVAGDDQLAANTPRPRAYSDNVGSMQLHQSAANNVIDRLGLQGRRCTPAELYHHVVAQLNIQDQRDLSQLPPDVMFQFAANDPLTLRFDEGKVELRLALDELKCADRSWSNFVVRVQFKPEVIDGRTYLVRDGIVRLSGPKLRTTDQISLRTVCAKVFPDDLRAGLWPEDLRTDPRFADLDIEQIDIRDGWLGVSIGPRGTIRAASHTTPTKR